MALTINTKIINDADNYTADAKQIRGGYVAVTTLTERDNLPAATTMNGSLCYVSNELKYYLYDGTQWNEAQFGGGNVDDVKVDGISVVTDKIANIDLATPLATKQDTLPSGSNDTYLHKNATTGNLEWSHVAQGIEIICSATEPQSLSVGGWWYYTPEPTIIDLNKFQLDNGSSLEIITDY